MLLNKEKICIKVNYKEYYISLKLKRRIWSDKNLDFTCIEIVEEDNLITRIEPFEIDENNYNIEYKLENYDKKEIIIGSLGEKNDIELSQGEIHYIQNNEEKFFHNCNINSVFAGGPIMLNNNLRVIGINCGFENNKNMGIYIKKIIENMEKRIIKCLVDIKLDKNKDGILLFNQNQNNKKEIQNNFKILYKDKVLDIKNIENKYIMSNNFNNFEKDGEYEIEIIFKNNLTNLSGFFEDCVELLWVDFSNFDISQVKDMGWIFKN